MSNKLHITGRLGADSELRYTKAGEPVLGFRVADDVGYGDKKVTNWWSCTLWGKRAETLAEYLKKGSQVVVHGEASTREHEGKTYLQCRVSDIDLVGGKPENHGERKAQPSQPNAPVDNFEADDIPF